MAGKAKHHYWFIWFRPKKYPANTGLEVDFFEVRGGINFFFSFGEKLYQENHSIAPFGAFFFAFQQIFKQAQYLFPDKKARLMPGN